jgi:hypothetical protein
MDEVFSELLVLSLEIGFFFFFFLLKALELGVNALMNFNIPSRSDKIQEKNLKLRHICQGKEHC